MEILVKNNLVDISGEVGPNSKQIIATVLSNLSYYGYALSKETYGQLTYLSDDSIKSWWNQLEPVLKKLTGDDKKMGDFVVYKNFPAEVLSMTESEYWFKQILMYWGFPNELFTQEEVSRQSMLEARAFKVLHLANKNSKQNILNGLLKLPNRWVNDQVDDVTTLVNEGLEVNMDIPFKENLVYVALLMIEKGKPIKVKSAMDVLRLAVGLSDGDVTLRTNTKFKNFKRKERRYLLSLLENTSNLEEDLARDKNRWKKLLHHLHPGDYGNAYPKVRSSYDLLYNSKVKSFNSKVETGIAARDINVLSLLANRPGDFVRRLNHLLQKFGYNALNVFKQKDVLGRLTVIQLLKLKKYLETINTRKFRTFPPKGNWTKVQVVENDIKIDNRIVVDLISNINDKISKKVSSVVPTVNIDISVCNIKLQNNDSDVLPYGRGTVFEIPDNIKFLRTASYWRAAKEKYNTWYDNGWLFYDSEWKPVGSCCWTNVKFGDAATFSGDPTSSKDIEGRACQMIDLYLDKLAKVGVRYAVWNILCYSRIKFSEAEEVYAALQWGEKPQTGKLFEPSRCQLSFPLQGDSYIKYIAYVDIQRKQVVYLDANLPSKTSSADVNKKRVGELMPAFVEYLETLPSVYDLFEGVKQDINGVPVVYTDREKPVIVDKAYVFKKENEQSKFEQLDITKLLV